MLKVPRLETIVSRLETIVWRPPMDSNDKQELIKYFNTQIGWCKILMIALKDCNNTVIDAFKECKWYNDEYMFEFSLIVGRFDIAQEYYDKLINDKNIIMFSVIFVPDVNKVIIEVKKNNFFHLKAISQERIKCDLKELETFINSLHD